MLESRLDQKGWGTFSSRHEILGILTEEFHELVEAVKSGDNVDVQSELVDIAVGALFGAVCIENNGTEW
jgi:NTP pyrophosphatase (non-canonical NTP hydrolase)